MKLTYLGKWPFRKGIDGRPFTSEGYERAKGIQQTNYGKTSEIINAFVENMLGLPVISRTWFIYFTLFT